MVRIPARSGHRHSDTGGMRRTATSLLLVALGATVGLPAAGCGPGAGEPLATKASSVRPMDEATASKLLGGGRSGSGGSSASGGSGSGGSEGSTPSDPTDLSLDDIDAIKSASTGATWVDKVNSTSIVNDRDVELAGPAAADGSGGTPLTAEEAMAACEAVRTGLEARQPALTVQVLNGTTVVAKGAAGVPCSPV